MKVFKVVIKLHDDKGKDICEATVNKVYKTKMNACKMAKKIREQYVMDADVIEEEVED